MRFVVTVLSAWLGLDILLLVAWHNIVSFYKRQEPGELPR